jgi:hypothetical protein
VKADYHHDNAGGSSVPQHSLPIPVNDVIPYQLNRKKKRKKKRLTN